MQKNGPIRRKAQDVSRVPTTGERQSSAENARANCKSGPQPGALVTRRSVQPGAVYICPVCKNPTSTICRKGKPVRCSDCIDKEFEAVMAKRTERQKRREAKNAEVYQRMQERMRVRDAARVERLARRRRNHKRWRVMQLDSP